MSTLAAVIGRILIGAYFIVTGAIMLVAPGPSDALFATAGFLPGTALGVGVVEVIGGLCLALGAMSRLTAIILAVWSALTVALFHPAVVTAAQVPGILMQLALIGGLLLVFAHSQMWWSWDAMRRQRRIDREALGVEQRVHNAELNAAQRAHDAELRAARAEGAVGAVNTTGTGIGTGINTGSTGPTGPTVVRRRWF